MTAYFFQQQDAHLRLSSELAPQEKLFLKKRLPLVHQTQMALLQTTFPLASTVRIAFCASGGGCRAMIYTAGALYGLAETGLLDAVLYSIGLSGSTWAMAPWVAHQMSPQQLKQHIFTCMQNHILPPLTDTVRTVLYKRRFGMPTSSVDYWGTVLAKKFLIQDRVLSEQASICLQGTFPLPIYTAVHEPVRKGKLHHWFEFSPFEIGCPDQAAFIPTWGFGRKFYAGKSVPTPKLGYPQEPSLGYYIGISSSAFTANLTEGLASDAVIEGGLIDKYKAEIEKTCNLLGIARRRISPACVHNFMRGVGQTAFSKLDHLTLIDAGAHSNLPLPPALRPERAVAIIIALDASMNGKSGKSIKKFAQYAKQHGLHFPTATTTHFNQACTVLHDTANPHAPIIVYLPLVKDTTVPLIKESSLLANLDVERLMKFGTYNTVNFYYTSRRIEQLFELGRLQIIAHKAILVNAIRTVLYKKHGD